MTARPIFYPIPPIHHRRFLPRLPFFSFAHPVSFPCIDSFPCFPFACPRLATAAELCFHPRSLVSSTPLQSPKHFSSQEYSWPPSRSAFVAVLSRHQQPTVTGRLSRVLSTELPPPPPNDNLYHIHTLEYRILSTTHESDCHPTLIGRQSSKPMLQNAV